MGMGGDAHIKDGKRRKGKGKSKRQKAEFMPDSTTLVCPPGLNTLFGTIDPDWFTPAPIASFTAVEAFEGSRRKRSDSQTSLDVILDNITRLSIEEAAASRKSGSSRLGRSKVTFEQEEDAEPETEDDIVIVSASEVEHVKKKKKKKKGKKKKKKEKLEDDAVDVEDDEVKDDDADGKEDLAKEVEKDFAEDEEDVDTKKKEKKKKKSKKSKKKDKDREEEEDVEDVEEIEGNAADVDEAERGEDEDDEEEAAVAKKKKKKKKKKDKDKDKDRDRDRDKGADEEEDVDDAAEEAEPKAKAKKKDKKKKDKKKKKKKKGDDDEGVDDQSVDVEREAGGPLLEATEAELKERLDELKRLAEEEDATMPPEGEEDGGEEAEVAGDVEEEELELGVQFDPERQICLGDPLKKGKRVYAADKLRGGQFRKAKIVSFEEPATYTVSFGLMRTQKKTHRLDIQVNPPKKLRKSKSFVARVLTKKDACDLADKGDVNGLLEALTANPALIDKPGGKENQTPLYYACKAGNEEIVKLLLRFGAEDDEDGTILEVATPEVKRILLTFGWGKVGKTS